MRRGRITTDEELLLLGEGGEEAEDEGEEQAGAAEDSTAREIKWASLPDGMKVLPSPEKLDDSLVSKLVYIRWEPPHGWSLGTITLKITSATPRLFKKFNFKPDCLFFQRCKVILQFLMFSYPILGMLAKIFNGFVQPSNCP